MTTRPAPATAENALRVTGLALLPLLVAAWAVAGTPRGGLALTAALAAQVVGLTAQLPLYVGGQRRRVALAEAALVAGLALVGPSPLLVLASCLAVVALDTARGRSVHDVTVNLGVIGLALTTAVVAAAAVGVEPVRHHVGRGDLMHVLAATAPGCLVAALVSTVASGVVVASVLLHRAQLPVTPRRLLAPVVPHVGTAVLQAAAGLAAVVLARVHPAYLLVTPAVVSALVLATRRQVRSRSEHDALVRLERATAPVDGTDLTEVLTSVARRASALFAAPALALVVRSYADPADVRVWEWAAGALTPGDATGAFLPESTDSFQVRTDDRHHHAPLVLGSGTVGVLRLPRTTSQPVVDVERTLLATFCQTAAAAVRTAQMFASVVEQAAHTAAEARQDPLTGLPNRLLLREALDDACRTASAEHPFALLLLDLDHFKEVNDTLGHAAGDAMLCEVAERLRAAAGADDVVARLGGDEFAMITRRPPTEVAEMLMARLTRPVEIAGLHLAPEVSLGVACHPHDALTSDGLLRCADTAMYDAKREGGSGHRQYDSHRDATSTERHALVTELRKALADDAFVLHYQPKVDLHDGRVVGVEALLRWQHAERGLLAPAAFIGVLEQSPLIGQVTRKVLGRALADVALWSAGGPVSVAVNVSPRVLLERDFPVAVASALSLHGVAAGQLVLEITETLAISEIEVVDEVLAGLRDLGVRLSVDDFGTGYSSLTFLQRVAVHEVKVDRSFVGRMLESREAMAIVRATVDLAHGLGLTVVAEGVETPEQLAVLRGIGCDQAQGYHLGRPAAATPLGLGAPFLIDLDVASRPLLGLARVHGAAAPA